MERIRVIGKRAHDGDEARITLEQGDDLVIVEAGNYDDLIVRLEVAARTLGWNPLCVGEG